MIFVHKASVFCLLTLLFAGCESPPHTPDADARMRANELLRTYSTKAALSEFVGSLPERCFQSSAVTELCQWSAAARQTAWQPMARAIATEDGVNLICELPVSAEPRSPGSCSIHPRRSNRYSWKSPNTEPAWAARRPRTDVAAVNQLTADRWIADAYTAVALSRLMGAIPSYCTQRRAEQTCVWRMTSETFGHGTLAVWIYASTKVKIRLRCLLPSDGSPRAPGSCDAEIGS